LGPSLDVIWERIKGECFVASPGLHRLFNNEDSLENMDPPLQADSIHSSLDEFATFLVTSLSEHTTPSDSFTSTPNPLPVTENENTSWDEIDNALSDWIKEAGSKLSVLSDK